MTQRKKIHHSPRFVSIKIKLLIACIIFVSLPTIVLGTLVFRAQYKTTFNNLKGQLTLMAKNWEITTHVYLDQLHRVVRREEVLVEKRLSSMTEMVYVQLEHVFRSHGDKQRPQEQQKLFDQLADVRLGRSGHVFITDGKGVFLLSQDRRARRDNFFKLVDQFNPNTELTYDALLKRVKTGGDDSVTVHYQWVDARHPGAQRRIVALRYFAQWDLIVGATMGYTDFKNEKLVYALQEELKEKIAVQQIGARGYIWVLNSKGEYIVSKNRLRDGENILDSRLDDGSLFVRTIIDNAWKLNPGQVSFMEYAWRNIGETKDYRKMAVIAHVKEWDWIIGVSAYYEDFFIGAFKIVEHIIWVCALAILLGSMVAYVFASMITSAVRRLRELALEAAQGNLNTQIDKDIMEGHDEIGELGQAFQVMTNKLKEKVAELEEKHVDLMEALKTSQKMHTELKLAQDKMIQTEKMASIGQLAAGVAHEINNPLGYIASNIESLERYIQGYHAILDQVEGGINDQGEFKDLAALDACVERVKETMGEVKYDFMRQDVGHLLDESKGGIERIYRIVHDLRDFSGKEKKEFDILNIHKILEGVENLVRNEIKYKADLVKVYDPVALVKGNEQRLSQVFINLILNALQAIDEKGVIAIRTFMQDEKVHVSVQDTGHGIAPEIKDKIFDAFFTTKPVGQGTGLGLSLSYEFVKAHGGEILVSSEINVGTTFTVVLPAVR